MKRIFLAIALVTMVIPTSSFGLTSTDQRSEDKEFAYDVVSIHPCPPGPVRVSVQQTADSFTARCSRLQRLMGYAYPNIIPWMQLVGFPEWTHSTSFDVDAKMDSATATELQKMTEEKQVEVRASMLRAVLAERFKLRLHFEFKESPAYDMVIANGGPKLKEAKPEETSRNGAITGLIVVQNEHINTLALLLAHIWLRPVVDKTGLTGKYDIRLKYLSDHSSNPMNDAPSIFTALQEELGLKLVPSKTQLKCSSWIM